MSPITVTAFALVLFVGASYAYNYPLVDDIQMNRVPFESVQTAPRGSAGMASYMSPTEELVAPEREMSVMEKVEAARRLIRLEELPRKTKKPEPKVQDPRVDDVEIFRVPYQSVKKPAKNHRIEANDLTANPSMDPLLPQLKPLSMDDFRN